MPALLGAITLPVFQPLREHRWSRQQAPGLVSCLCPALMRFGYSVSRLKCALALQCREGRELVTSAGPWHVLGPHLAHRRQSMALPEESTCVRLEPPAWHCPVARGPLPQETQCPAAGRGHLVSGPSIPTFTLGAQLPGPILTSQGDSRETGSSCTPGALLLLLLLPPRPYGALCTPLWPLCLIVGVFTGWGCELGLSSGVCRHAWPATAPHKGQSGQLLSKATQPQIPGCQVGQQPSSTLLGCSLQVSIL